MQEINVLYLSASYSDWASAAVGCLPSAAGVWHRCCKSVSSSLNTAGMLQRFEAVTVSTLALNVRVWRSTMPFR